MTVYHHITGFIWRYTFRTISWNFYLIFVSFCKWEPVIHTKWGNTHILQVAWWLQVLKKRMET